MLTQAWLVLTLVILQHSINTHCFNLKDKSQHNQYNAKRLQICDEHTGLLQLQDVQRLRDLFQEHEMYTRIHTDMGNLLNSMSSPPTKPEDIAAWKTDWSEEYVTARRDGAQQQLTRVEEALRVEVGRLREAGRLKPHTKLQHLVPCTMFRLNTALFPDRPEVSFLLQYYKRPSIVQPLLQVLHGACNKLVPSELVVNVDSPQEGAMWANLSYATQGFVVPVFSHNIHEARSYNRMASLARGKYLIFLQDDDTLQPANCSWLPPILRQFEAMPKLGVIGLKGMRRGEGLCGNREWLPSSFHDYADPATTNTFTFPMKVDYAPMAVRRSAFKQVGGVDEGMSDKGMCGIATDWELSFRMWAAGWHVGFMPVLRKGRADDQPGSTHTPENEGRCWGRQMNLGHHVISARWGNGWKKGGGRFLEDLENDARLLNLKLLTPLWEKRGDTCPFRKGCEPSGNPPVPDECKIFYRYDVDPLVEVPGMS